MDKFGRLMYGMKIGAREVGGGALVFIIAEIGINHDNKLSQAMALIDAAKKAGCDAVKFQLFRAERMYVKGAGKYETASQGNRDIMEIIRENELPHEWLPKLKVRAHENNLALIVTACDEESVDVLDLVGVDAIKAASYAVTHLPLLRHMAGKGRPMLMSAGGATMRETAEAVELLQNSGQKEIVLNHCMAKYPVAVEDCNLRVIETLEKAFPEMVIGYSDHTSEPATAAKAAVVLGAKAIEKHITLDKNLPGPDHSFALDPKELELMVKTIRTVERKMGEGVEVRFEKKVLGSGERKTYLVEEYVREFAYRSVFARRKIKRGERFSSSNMVVLRPGNKKRGLHPRYYSLLKNKYRAVRDIAAHKAVNWDDVLTRRS